MKRIIQPICGIIAGLLLTACDHEAPVAKIIETNKKMPLVEWPDSLYIATLDSILATEPLKKKNPGDNMNISMNMREAPIFRLPGSVTGQKETAKTTKSVSSSKGNKMSGTDANRSAEDFMDKFSKALSALQSDPSNASLYKVVEARDGEDLFKLLKRTYGAGSQNLPRFYVLSTLQSVNAGVMLEHLNAGDKVRVPRI